MALLNGGSGFDLASYATETTRGVADLRFGTALLPQGSLTAADFDLA